MESGYRRALTARTEVTAVTHDEKRTVLAGRPASLMWS